MNGFIQLRLRGKSELGKELGLLALKECINSSTEKCLVTGELDLGFLNHVLTQMRILSWAWERAEPLPGRPGVLAATGAEGCAVLEFNICLSLWRAYQYIFSLGLLSYGTSLLSEERVLPAVFSLLPPHFSLLPPRSYTMAGCTKATNSKLYVAESGCLSQNTMSLTTANTNYKLHPITVMGPVIFGFYKWRWMRASAAGGSTDLVSDLKCAQMRMETWIQSDQFRKGNRSRKRGSTTHWTCSTGMNLRK